MAWRYHFTEHQIKQVFISIHPSTTQTIRSPMTTLMKACLSKSVGLIANVSADSIQLKEYSEDYSNNLGAILDEYRISGTMTICESNQGQALLALNASIQGKTYDKALSKCLGTNVSLVAASFTPLRADKPSWSFTPRPTHTATPRPTLFTEHGKNYCDTVIFRSMNAIYF